MGGLGIGLGISLGGGGSGGGAKLTASATGFVTSVSQGTLIATLSDPFGGGSTFSVVGSTPGQLALSTNQVLKGASAAVAGTGYTLTIRAAKAGRAIEEPFVFTAAAGIPAPYLSLSSAVTQAEGNSGTASFVWTLTLTRDGSTASFPYSCAVTGTGGSPADATDFGGTFPSSSGTFAPGETSKTITVLVQGDTAVEPAETFLLTVTAAGLTSVTSTGTISNDDAGGTYDYLVTSDSEMATVLGLSNATLAGKTIGVAPGLYASRTITNRPTSKLTITATDPANMPRFMRWTAQDITNIDFVNIDRVTDSWGTSLVPAWYWAATTGVGNSNIRFVGGRCRGNWRGDIDFGFDPNAEYGEFANLIPQFASDGSVAGLTIRNSLVESFTPNSLPNGTYVNALNFTAGASANGITFSTQPQTTFIVSGGVITSATVQSGGVSTGTTAINGSTGILSKIITWAGQKRPTDIMPQGEKVLTGSYNASDVFTGLIEWLGVSFSLLSAGSRGSLAGAGGINFDGNSFDMIYGDCMSYGASANATQAPVVRIKWNTVTRPFSSTKDPADPHSDPIQLFFAKATNAFDWPIEIVGNMAWIGVARGAFQGLLIADPPTSGSYGYTGYIYGNVDLNADLTNGVVVEQQRDLYLADNTVARFTPGDAVNGSRSVNAGAGVVGAKNIGQSLFIGNIAEGTVTGSITVGDATVTQSLNSNVVMGAGGVTIPYTDVFASPAATRVTKANVLAAYAPKPAYSGKGAIGRYIDHAAKTVDLTQQVTFVNFPTLTGQAQSTAVNSGWRKIIGGPGTGSISVTGGTYQFADDAAGTNATTATSSAGTYTRDKWVRLNQTTASAGSTNVNTTITLRGTTTYTFTGVTASTAVFPLAGFNTSTRLVEPAGALAPADSRYMTGAMRIRFPSGTPVGHSVFITQSGAGVLNVQMLSTGFLRITIANAASASIAVLNHSGSSLYDGAWHDIQWSFDVDQAAAADGRKIVIDGVDRTTAVGTWVGGSGVQIGYTRTASGVQYGFNGTAATKGAFDLAYFYLNAVTRLDITDPAIQSKFTADMIGTTGNGPSGSQPRKFLVGNAAQWNGGTAQRGAGGTYTIAEGAVTDVTPGQAAWT